MAVDMVKLELVMEIQTTASTVNQRAREGSFTEDMIFPLPTSGTVETQWVNPWISKRAPLMPSSLAVVGYRAQTFSSVDKILGPSITHRISRPGLPNEPCDLPQVACQIKLFADGDTGYANKYVHAIPKSQSTSGEFSPTPAYLAAMQDLIRFLENNGRFFGDVRGPGIPLQSIAMDGTIITRAPHSFVPGNTITTLRAHDSNGHAVHIVGVVSAVTDNLHLSLNTATWRVTSKRSILWPVVNGTIRLQQIGVRAYRNNAGDPRGRPVGEIIGSTTRKIGRPFDHFTGRQSRNR